MPVVAALDWVPLMVYKAKAKCEQLNLDINVFKHDIAASAPPGHWQLALTRHCLMHIPPSRIQTAVRNISEICDEALIFEWWLNYAPPKDTGHCFLHDYERLFEGVNQHLFTRFDCTGEVRQTLFWFKKEM